MQYSGENMHKTKVFCIKGANYAKMEQILSVHIFMHVPKSNLFSPTSLLSVSRIFFIVPLQGNARSDIYLLPYIMECNAESPAAPKYIHIAKAMGVNTDGMTEAEGVKAAIEAVKALSISIQIPQKLHEINVKEEDIPTLAVAAFNDVCTGGNPRSASVEDIETLYRFLCLLVLLKWPKRIKSPHSSIFPASCFT